jgi:hypothetical protein
MARELPVHPDLDQLKHQAKELLRALRRGDPAAIAELAAHHPKPVEPARAKLADAQLVLARSHGAASWPRLAIACRLTDAIHRDDADTVRALIGRHRTLLHEPARGVPSNWGPPMSYAANLGRSRIVALLHQAGARDLQHAFDRACLQGQLATARQLYALGARPAAGALMGPAETLDADGTAYLLELGAPIGDAVQMVLETYSRAPEAKHRCLELLATRVALPDTAALAVHRGRLDLLEAIAQRDPSIVTRRFAHAELYPPSLGCHTDESLALHGTPLAGATLLHVCIDYGELAIARWLLDRGVDPDIRAARDRDGFGGHTPLFGCVVSQLQRCGLATDSLTQLLLERGADPSARASLRKRLRFTDDESLHEYRDVTPRSWGERFHAPEWVSRSAIALIAERGGRR